ncbi:MAG: hypothetical protein ACMXYM_00325 [Candidatus Woesearchaeota archaeon]
MRGVAYTFIAIILSSVVFVFATTIDQPTRATQSPISIVQSMNAVIDAFEEDLERGVYISSYRTVIGQIEKITQTGEYLVDLNASYHEGMLNRTIEGVNVSALNGSGLIDWLDRTRTIYANRGYHFEYEIISLEQYHTTPYAITNAATLTYNLSDPRQERRYERDIRVEVDIPVGGLEDPAYYMASIGRISNIVEFTNETDIPTLINWSMMNSKYRSSNKSPSFLMRLEGNFSASEHGIESIVSGQRFLVQGVGTYDGRSSIDALYFSTIAHEAQCMSGTPDWFRLDTDRLDDYTGSTNVTC